MQDDNEAWRQGFEHGQALIRDILLLELLHEVCRLTGDPAATAGALRARAMAQIAGINTGDGVDGPLLRGAKDGAAAALDRYFPAPRARH